MKKSLHSALVVLACAMMLTLSGCFSEKDSPFYDSEWIMKNQDAQGQIYYHYLTLLPNHQAKLEVSFEDSPYTILWIGKYKLNAKKIIFDFSDCVRYTNGQPTERYNSGKVLNFYKGDFFYS